MAFKRRHNTGRNIVIGSAIAGVVGYLAGILTAPKSGKQTRDELAGKADDIKEDSLAQLQDLNDELKDVIKTTKVKTIALSSSARAEFNEAVVRAKDAQNKASQVIKAAKAGEADDPELNKAVKQGRQALKNLAKYLKS